MRSSGQASYQSPARGVRVANLHRQARTAEPSGRSRRPPVHHSHGVARRGDLVVSHRTQGQDRQGRRSFPEQWRACRERGGGPGTGNCQCAAMASAIARRSGQGRADLDPLRTPPAPIHAVWPAINLPAAKTRLFIDFLAARLTRNACDPQASNSAMAANSGPTRQRMVARRPQITRLILPTTWQSSPLPPIARKSAEDAKDACAATPRCRCDREAIVGRFPQRGAAVRLPSHS